MRHLLFLAVLALCYRTEILLHFAQSDEIGIEQLPEHTLTDKITFFAVVRKERSRNDYDYVLSFGAPKCEETCLQSANDLCNENGKVINQNWENLELDHFPKDNDPSAVYIRRTVSMSELLCDESTVVRTVDAETGVIRVVGDLILSTTSECTNSCPLFKTSDSIPFDISYDPNTKEFTGLTYRLSKYEYSAEPTRNIRIDGLGLIVEITTMISLSGMSDSTTPTTAPPYFSNAVVFQQDTVPAMKVIAITDCDELAGSQCTQRMYLSPIEPSGTAYGSAIGDMEIHADLLSSGGQKSSQIILHAAMNIVSSNDFGTMQRAIDLIMGTRNTADSTIKPYIADAEGINNLLNDESVCVSVSSPELTPTTITGVQLCASATVDIGTMQGCQTPGLTDMAKRVIYNVNEDIRQGLLIVPEGRDSEAAFCFNMKKIIDNAHVVEVTYAYTIADELNQTSSQIANFQTKFVAKRNLYDNNIATTESCWVDCPWGEEWDDWSGCCVPCCGANDAWDTWVIVLVIILGLGICGVCVALLVFSDSYYGPTGAYAMPYWQPCYVEVPGHPGHYKKAFRDDNSGKVITNIIIDGDGNTVIPDSENKPVRNTRNTRRKPTSN